MSHPGKKGERRAYTVGWVNRTGAVEHLPITWQKQPLRWNLPPMGSYASQCIFVSVLVCLYPSKSEQCGLAFHHRRGCVCLLLALLLRSSIFRPGEGRKKREKYSWDKGFPSNYVMSLLLIPLAALNQALGSLTNDRWNSHQAVCRSWKLTPIIPSGLFLQRCKVCFLKLLWTQFPWF